MPGVPNVKANGNCAETNEIFQYFGCLWHGCLCMPNRHKPIGKTEETLQNKYEETKARLQKIESAGYKVVSKWGVSLENCCAKILALKINFARNRM